MSCPAGDTVIVVNLLVLGDRPPGGTGHYAISLFEHMNSLIAAEGRPVRLIGVASAGAERYFSADVLPALRILPSGSAWVRVINELWRLPRLARRERADILFNPAFLGPAWGTPRRAVTVHDLYFRTVPRLVPRRRRWLLRLVTPLLARFSHVILTDSQASLREIHDHYPGWAGRTRVVYCGSRLLGPRQDAGTATVRDPEPFVLIVGNLTPNKQPEVVIEAVRLLRDAGRTVRVVHVGDDHGRLEPAARRFGVVEQVQRLGRRTDDELADLYRTCAAVILPSLHEGFGLPLIEAQSLGAPVIASTRGALPEVAGDSARFFAVEDARSCAEAIADLLDDDVARAALIDAGHRNAARFSWAHAARETLAALTAD